MPRRFFIDVVLAVVVMVEVLMVLVVVIVVLMEDGRRYELQGQQQSC